MIDELDAVARLGDDAAPPNADAYAGARRALEQAISAERAGRSRPLRRPTVLRVLAISAVAAAVVAAAVIASAVGNGGGTTGNAVPSGLRAAILTAYNDAAADILYVHQAFTAPNGTNYVEDQWSRLSQGGRQVQTRITFSDASSHRIRDAEITYTLPPQAARFSPLGDVVDVEYANHTWFHQANGPMPSPPWEIPDAIAVGSLASALAHGKWSDLGASTIDGRAAIALVQHNPPGGKSLTVWVDPETYRPFKESFTYAGTNQGRRVDGTVTSSLEYLQPTTANAAQLHVTVPPGFTETTRSS